MVSTSRPYTESDYVAMCVGHEAGMSNEEIGEQIGRTPRQVEYHLIRMGVIKRPLETVATATSINRNIRDDLAFQAAMRAAIKAGRERAPLSIDTTPSTERPTFGFAQSLTCSSIGSSASQCSDLGGAERSDATAFI